MAKPKLLTIDDEVEFVEMIKNFFSLRGYEVFTALRAQAGIDIMLKEKPSVVLMDLKMPGMDGDLLFRKMHQINPEVKAIMITAYKDEGQTEKKFMEMGVFAYFEKPITSMRELENAVKNAVCGCGGG